MARVRVTGWKPGFKKIEFNWLLRECSDLSLAERKNFVDRILDGEVVEVDVLSCSVPEFLERASEMGATCESV